MPERQAQICVARYHRRAISRYLAQSWAQPVLPSATMSASFPRSEAARGAAKRPLRVLLAAPRGFCAGVERAVAAVEEALTRFGAPVYVRHEIVHNRSVVRRLESLGAVFVRELDAVPDDRPVITSAHGIARSVAEEAAARGLFHIDATCPLVEKVHREVQRHTAAGRQVILLGHRGHPEVVGTLGRADAGMVLLAETLADCDTVSPRDPQHLAWATQTTLSVRDTATLIARLRVRFPQIVGPRRADICYATSNRQEAVALLAPLCDAFFVLGAENSSNSRRLVEVAIAEGCARAHLIESAAALETESFAGISTIGLTAGASAPETLVAETLAHLGARFTLSVEERAGTLERVRFAPPRALAR